MAESLVGSCEKSEDQLSRNIIKPIVVMTLESISVRLVHLEERVSDMEEILDSQVLNSSEEGMT